MQKLKIRKDCLLSFVVCFHDFQCQAYTTVALWDFFLSSRFVNWACVAFNFSFNFANFKKVKSASAMYCFIK